MVAKKHPNDMTEEELARFFEEHKDDLSLWQDKPAKIRVRRGGPSTVFTMRLAPDELEKLYWAAREANKTVSDFVRSAALAAAEHSPVADRSKRKRSRSDVDS